MRGDITLKILEGIHGMALDAVDLVDVFLITPYGSSMGRFKYELSQRNKERGRERLKRTAEAQLRRRYADMLYRLRSDNLIETRGVRGRKMFALTNEGLKKLQDLQARRRNKFPDITYEQMEGTGTLIVTFDIPEKEKRKREWLRAALQHLGFRMIQKSVWVGSGKLPKEFLDDLLKLELVACVEIFEATKKGTLRHVV